MFVLDVTMNFMLNKRKSKKRLGLRPRPHWGSYQRSPRPPCCHGRGTPPPVPSPSCEYIYWTPLSPNPGSAPAYACIDASWSPFLFSNVYACSIIISSNHTRPFVHRKLWLTISSFGVIGFGSALAIVPTCSDLLNIAK